MTVLSHCQMKMEHVFLNWRKDFVVIQELVVRGVVKLMLNDNRYCQALRNNQGDVVVKLRQKIAGAKKRKADCLGESKNIPTTFKEPRFRGVTSLPNRTLLRMLEITYENQTRILKLEERFHNKKKEILI